MAEREGFEPPVPVKVRLISSQVHSTGLCHLSVVSATNQNHYGLPFAKLNARKYRCQLRCQLASEKSAPTCQQRLRCERERDVNSASSSTVICDRVALRRCGCPLQPLPVYWRRCGDCNATCTRSPQHPSMRNETSHGHFAKMTHSSCDSERRGTWLPYLSCRVPSEKPVRLSSRGCGA